MCESPRSSRESPRIFRESPRITPRISANLLRIFANLMRIFREFHVNVCSVTVILRLRLIRQAAMSSQRSTRGKCEYSKVFTLGWHVHLSPSFIPRYVTLNYRQKEGEENQLKFIPDYHRAYDPLQYPLIFPDGQDGWHCNLSHTCLQHVNFQLMERFKDDKTGKRKKKVVNPILRGRSLGQQYMVDQFAKSELSRLNYIEHHQKELHAKLYL